MKRIAWLLSILFMIACARGERQEQVQAATNNKEVGGMNISSPAFRDNGSIPPKYTCDGANTNPPLVFAAVPQNAKSLALVVDDPDAPGGTFDHWIIWNISPSATNIAEGQPPQGVAGRNGFGKSGYGGPCPPSGEHRYQFRLYALDTTLNLPASSSKADLEKALNGHISAQAQMVGRYRRGS